MARCVRVLHRDMKAGEIKVRIENADDLWHLHNLVVPGDRLRASTYRREEAKADKLRPERMEKVRVTVTLRADKVEFHPFSDRLRISGVIVDGSMDLGQHHTLNVEVDDVLTLVKDVWRPHELKRIDEAVAAAQRPLVMFLSLDDDEALLAQLRQYGVREIATIRAPSHGKMFPSGETKDAYYDDILAKLRTTDLGEALVLVGPGFARDELREFLQAKAPQLASRIHVHGTAHAGMRGVQEALRSGVGSKVFEDSRVALETRLVERVLEAIGKADPVAYGPAEVAEAVEAGAVASLLVSDEVVRDPQIEGIMRDAEAARGAIVLVSRHHEAGAKLASLGGIAALLRFPIK